MPRAPGRAGLPLRRGTAAPPCSTKWNFRLNYWGFPSPTFTREGVELDRWSHLRLHLLEKDGDYFSPHLQTGSNTFHIPKDTNGFWPFGQYQPAKFMHRFGFYEIRYGKNSQWYGHFWFPFVETADGWHDYSVDWRPDGYTFYADGQKIGVQEAPVSEVEQFVLVSTECHGYHRYFGNRGGLEKVGGEGQKPHPVDELRSAVLPDYFEVDFVRVFDAVGSP